MKTLLTVAVLLCTCSVSAQDCKGPSEYVATCYETLPLGEGVYAFLAPESPGGVVTGSSVLVIGRDAALLFDSGHFPSVTRKMLAEIRRLTDRPVRYLVNSHWHPDHNAANGIVAEVYPGLQIIATRHTREQFAKKVTKNADPKMYRDTVNGIGAALRDGRFFDGSPLDAAKSKYLETAKAEFEWMVPEVEAARHTPPNVTLSKELDVDLGGRTARVMFLGRGNTAGDVILHVPDAGVLASGDLVVHPVPYAHGCYPGEWIETLRALSALDATTIVPGHGRILRDRSYIKQVIALLEAMRGQVSAAVAGRRDPQTIRAGLNFDKFVSTLPPDPAWRIAFDSFFVGPALERAIAETKNPRLPDE